MCSVSSSFLLGLRKIKALCVWCNNVERGCGWEGTVGTLEDHATKCGITQVPCPNGCKREDEMTLQLLKKTGRATLNVVYYCLVFFCTYILHCISLFFDRMKQTNILSESE